ncbi:amidohydrolase [Aequorivita xiaoshiensis]|uniref:Amidohydrolase n=1 Tax=Aequorivita xiaoshiensis TaxID=2874476 RepID=A0A9X1U6V6_9FLAO|nr:amidohydrolase [Aequorivita xiaoshiensis]MCG2431592.1 amidohydrolase [Aequorivita xiaoshiensis]
MIDKILITTLAIVLLLGCENKSKQMETATANLYFNGHIITMDTEDPTYADVIVEQDGKIAFVGTLEEAEKQFSNLNKIDLNGKTLLPGFIDPHSHFGMVSNTMGQVDLNPEPVGTVENIDDILIKLKNYKEENNIPDGEWIYGWGYDDGELAEKRHPTKKDIDKVLPNNPVYLQHTSGHMGVANSLGLEELKVNSETKNPKGGNIDRFPNTQDPTGLVQETAMYPFVRLMLEKLASKQEEFFETTQEYYASNGITTAQDGMTDRNTIRFFQSQADEGKFKIDLISLAGYAELESNLKDTTLLFKTYKNGFKIQGTKLVADGSPQGKTAFFTKPFLTEVPGCNHDCRGLPSLTQETINTLFVMAYEKDNQLFIHCNGDATVDMIITAHENACKVLNQPLDKDRRTIIIHAQFSRPDQLETFKKYNMEPSFFTNHAYFWGDVHVENLGKERADFLSPMASSIKLGLKPTNHSDATVTPIDPIFTIWTAVNRVSRSGATIGEAEKVSPFHAIKAITANAAYEFFEEDIKGTLSTGKLADFVILDKNPLTVEAMEIKNIKIMETIKEGKSIFARENDNEIVNKN